MQRLSRPYTLFAVLALVAASTLALTGAFAGDEGAPASSASVTKTPSPMHSIMAWVSTSVVGDLDSPCPSCPKAEKAWRAWFEGGADVPMAGLRDRLVADGWNADRYVGYFQTLAKAHEKPSGEGDCCGHCDGKDCGDCPNKGNCDDCPNKGNCGDCPSKGNCDKAGSKGCDSCPGGCPKSTEAETEPETTAAK